MELKWLEDFLSLARTKSFSRSAAERNVTQPAFSRRIQSLERWLGAALVDRSGYPARLTREGEAFREIAEQTVRELIRARDDARQTRRRAEDTLVFSATHSIALAFFPGWIGSVARDGAPLETQMVADNMHDCVQNLAEGVCDFLICYEHRGSPLLLDVDRYPSRHLADDRLVPVSAPSGSAQPRYTLPGAPADPLPYLGYAADSFLGRAVADLLGRAAPRCWLAPRYQDSLAGALAAMARAGHGIAWVPMGLVSEDLATGALHRAGGAEWDIPLGISIHRSSERTRPQVEAFWARLPGGDQR